MGNEMKNVARGFKFLWATFSETMGNVFSRHGQCFLSLSVGCPLVVSWLSVGYACRLHPRLCSCHRAAVPVAPSGRFPPDDAWGCVINAVGVVGI